MNFKYTNMDICTHWQPKNGTSLVANCWQRHKESIGVNYISLLDGANFLFFSIQSDTSFETTDTGWVHRVWRACLLRSFAGIHCIYLRQWLHTEMFTHPSANRAWLVWLRPMLHDWAKLLRKCTDNICKLLVTWQITYIPLTFLTDRKVLCCSMIPWITRLNSLTHRNTTWQNRPPSSEQFTQMQLD